MRVQAFLTAMAINLKQLAAALALLLAVLWRLALVLHQGEFTNRAGNVVLIG